MSRFDWCVHGRHADCHRQGTTPNGVLRCTCPCHDDEDGTD